MPNFTYIGEGRLETYLVNEPLYKGDIVKSTPQTVRQLESNPLFEKVSKKKKKKVVEEVVKEEPKKEVIEEIVKEISNSTIDG